MADVHYLERGDGPTVVFLHGIGVDSESFAFQLEAFAQAGYHAVSWDMPGYGRSGPLTPMTFPGLARRLQQLLDELNVSPVHVVGHSIGGMIVQQLARTAQHKLANNGPCADLPSVWESGWRVSEKVRSRAAATTTRGDSQWPISPRKFCPV